MLLGLFLTSEPVRLRSARHVDVTSPVVLVARDKSFGSFAFDQTASREEAGEGRVAVCPGGRAAAHGSEGSVLPF